MRKIIAITLLVCTMFLIACNSDSIEEKVNKSVNVSLGIEGDAYTKELVSTFTDFDKDSLYWRYTAQKKDSGARIGETTSETNVKASGTGLGNLSGKFSVGIWEFRLYAYKSDNFTDLMYEGVNSNVIFSGDKPSELVTININPVTRDTGTLAVAKLEPVAAVSAETSQTVYIANTLTPTDWTSYTDMPLELSIPSGTYNVKVELSYPVETDQYVVTASESICITIYKNITTTISGNVDELTSHIILDAEEPVSVTFDTKGGSSIASQLIVKGNYSTAPAENPVKEGYEFCGWTTDSNATTSSPEFDFANTPINENTTIYALWNSTDEEEDENDPCLLKGTMILLSDGNLKAIEDIQINDSVVTYNFYSGQFESKKILFIEKGSGNITTLTMSTDDGSSICIVDRHFFFDCADKQYVEINTNNYNQMIGRRILVNEGNTLKEVTIDNITLDYQENEYFGLITEDNVNCFANGYLTSEPTYCGLIPFDVNDSYVVDADKMADDIAIYGEYTYSTYPYTLSEQLFDSLPFKYIKVLLGKGLVNTNQLQFEMEYAKVIFENWK